MNIDIKLDKTFTEELIKLKAEYGEKFARLNGLADEQLNYTDFIDNFIDKSNVASASIDGNANVCTKDVTSLLNEMNKPHMKLLSLNKIFYEMCKKYGAARAKEWLRAEWTGVFYLHDSFESSFKSYCFSYDLTDVATKGLFFIPNFNAQAPQHLTTFTDFTAEYVSWNSNRTSGGSSLPNFLVWSYYFWKKDCDTGFIIKSPEYYRDQEFQRFIYKLNQPFLRITQSAYTTLSIMDRNYLSELFGDMVYPDGSFVIDCIEELIEYERAFVKMMHKIRQQNMMTFPVCSYSLLFDYESNKFVDEEFARFASDENAYWQDYNFSIDDAVTSLSSCCRLRNQVVDDEDDTEDTLGNFSSIGGSALEVGSVKVNTINLANIGYKVDKDEDKYIEVLKERLYLCGDLLSVIRNIIKRNIEKGLLPNYTLGMINMDKQYGTIGICALWETIKYFGYTKTDAFGCITYSEQGIAFAKRIFDTIASIKSDMRKKHGFKFNIEQIPGERACAVLLQKDKLIYPDKVSCNSLYSNQWIGLSENTNIKEKIAVGKELDGYMGGGVITHINTDAPFNSKDTAWRMLNYIARQHIPYFAFNSKQNSCKYNHGFYGDTCPVCGGGVERQWTRIVGFTVPTTTFSNERKAEYEERKWSNPQDFDLLFD